MTKKTEQAHKYVDKELNNEETKVFEERMLADTKLVDEVTQYMELKNKIKINYGKMHSKKYQQYNSCAKEGSFYGYCKQAVAASVVVVVAVLTLSSINFKNKAAVGVEQVAKIENAPRGFTLKPVKYDNSKLMLHISSSNIETLDKALKQAESLLLQYEKQNKPLELEVIANSGGVDLLRVAKTPYAKKVLALQKRFKHIQFVACFNTLNRLAANGEDVKLLPGVTADMPVVDKIIGQIQHGWTYVKI